MGAKQMKNKEDLFKDNIKAILDVYGHDASLMKDNILAYFEAHRHEYFEQAEITLQAPQRYSMCMTCSCGSTDESCEEDGQGSFSNFYIMPDGELFRMKELK